MTALPLPIHPVIMPADLAGTANGGLRADQLASVGQRGLLHPAAAAAWSALVAEAAAAGIALTYTYGGTYRALADQVALFRSRYTLARIANRPTKRWNGVTWWQLPNTAMAAVPGTSNHGWGLAIDTALGASPGAATSITPRLGWLLDHAPAHGFSWETESEPWHIRYIAGDRAPAPAVDDPPAPAPIETVPMPPPATVEFHELDAGPYDPNGDAMPGTNPKIIVDERWPNAILVGDGAPRWLSPEEYAAHLADGVALVKCAAHESFLILAARAGITSL